MGLAAPTLTAVTVTARSEHRHKEHMPDADVPPRKVALVCVQ